MQIQLKIHGRQESAYRKNMRMNRKIEGGMSLLLRLNVQNNLTWRRAERTKTEDYRPRRCDEPGTALTWMVRPNVQTGGEKKKKKKKSPDLESKTADQSSVQAGTVHTRGHPPHPNGKP